VRLISRLTVEGERSSSLAKSAANLCRRHAEALIWINGHSCDKGAGDDDRAQHRQHIFNPHMLWALLTEVPVWVWIAFALFNLLLAYVWWAEGRNPNRVKIPPISKTQLKKNKRQQQK
jgi:hypothetical protein